MLPISSSFRSGGDSNTQRSDAAPNPIPVASAPNKAGRLRKLPRLVPYLAVLIFVLAVFFQILDDSDGDVKAQALLLVFLAALSISVCGYWAFRVLQHVACSADYIKATTTSRTILCFWILLLIASAGANLFGMGSDLFTPLTEGMLTSFAGFGSVLLTAGPAYKEYKEATSRAAHETEIKKREAGPAPSPVTSTASKKSMALTVAVIITCFAIFSTRQRSSGPKTP